MTSTFKDNSLDLTSTESSAKWTIKSLWIGDSLSVLEQLSLKSFLHHGHRVELFCYTDIKNVPKGVIIRNANEILSEKLIFTYKDRPSYAAFANWFRYVMLYKEGGVWVDTDIIALKPFDFDQDIFFGRQQPNRINNAVVGAKTGIAFLKFMAKQAAEPNRFLPYDTIQEKREKLIRRFLKGNHRGNIKWGETGPRGLTRAAKYFGFQKNALPVNTFYPIHWSDWKDIFDESYPEPETSFPDSYAIHLWNELMRKEGDFNKEKTYSHDSLIEALKRRYL